MKKIRILQVVLLLIIGFTSTINISRVKEVNAISNSSYITMEISTNRVLYGENIHDKKYMASTTKILTAITIIENCRLDEIITIDKNCVGIEGSSIYLEVGEKLSVKDLLYGLMLRSGNDCAVALALHCSKSIEDFARLMNETALKVGAKESNFVNPHGLHDENHYTTAYDLALISSYAIKNDNFREIVSTKKVSIPFTTREYDRVLFNKNKMLGTYDGATGIKTGYTKKAGRCLVSSAIKDGMHVVCVVLNCPDMWNKSTSLLDKSFDNYGMYKIVDSKFVLGYVDIENDFEKCGVKTKSDILLPLKKDEKDNIKIEYNLPKSMKKPFKKGEIVGEIKIYTLNNLIFSQEIYTIIEKNQ